MTINGLFDESVMPHMIDLGTIEESLFDESVMTLTIDLGTIEKSVRLYQRVEE